MKSGDLRRLVVLRHAKSAWPPDVADSERPPAPPGRRDASAVGRWLREAGCVRDLVVCSSALRTRQTWGLVAAEFAATTAVIQEARIYRAGAGELLSLHPAGVRIAIVCDNYSPHLTTKRCQRVGTWAAADNVEIAYTPTNSSWLNRIEAQVTALRCFALDGTDHTSHKQQGSMIRRYIIWRNKHAADERLSEVVKRANVA
ncbi:histidine phosphatase family protein [Streptomyces sp. NBC_01443]|uniref:SixA phosphatase family protein n=1 Tax=Streptomyces sp. NBC_01443 TaxID=2903868 RepID=UPI002257AA66|nr:histidine phosphatase family protein [Streptomyces sp. NBC_01443]MCX4625372.1 histidine phosphatase family protein [Streptomyces sp. NBC_01443]